MLYYSGEMWVGVHLSVRVNHTAQDGGDAIAMQETKPHGAGWG